MVVFGGEVGVRFGLFFMFLGNFYVWICIELVLKVIFVKVDVIMGKLIESFIFGKFVLEGELCVIYIGFIGVGYYVKMVYNGIEYVDM